VRSCCFHRRVNCLSNCASSSKTTPKHTCAFQRTNIPPTKIAIPSPQQRGGGGGHHFSREKANVRIRESESENPQSPSPRERRRHSSSVFETSTFRCSVSFQRTFEVGSRKSKSLLAANGKPKRKKIRKAKSSWQRKAQVVIGCDSNYFSCANSE